MKSSARAGTTAIGWLAVLFVAFVSPVLAQQITDPAEESAQTGDPDPDFPQLGHSLGKLNWVFSAGLSLGYDSNVTLANEDTIGSSFYVLSPAIRVELPSKKSLLSLSYRKDIQQFEDSPIDDFDTDSWLAQFEYDPTLRVAIKLSADYQKGEDRRGTGGRQGNLGLLDIAPDRFESTSFGGDWSYGRAGARGRLELYGSAGDIKYQNNRDRTEQLDREEQTIGSSFFWRITQKTSAVISYSEKYVDYDLADADSDERRYMAGLSWKMTAKTSGKVSFGRQEKDFDDPNRRSHKGSTWEAIVNWRHSPKSHFTLRSSRIPQESDGFGDFVLTTETSLTWRYTRKNGFNTTLKLGVSDEDHRGARSDTLASGNIASTWPLGRRFKLGASINYSNRDSNVREFNYNQALFQLTLQGTF